MFPDPGISDRDSFVALITIKRDSVSKENGNDKDPIVPDVSRWIEPFLFLRKFEKFLELKAIIVKYNVHMTKARES